MNITNNKHYTMKKYIDMTLTDNECLMKNTTIRTRYH